MASYSWQSSNNIESNRKSWILFYNIEKINNLNVKQNSFGILGAPIWFMLTLSRVCAKGLH